MAHGQHAVVLLVLGPPVCEPDLSATRYRWHLEQNATQTISSDVSIVAAYHHTVRVRLANHRLGLAHDKRLAVNSSGGGARVSSLRNAATRANMYTCKQADTDTFHQRSTEQGNVAHGCGGGNSQYIYARV